MTRASKLPPPDTRENIIGRIEQLKRDAHQNAMLEVREGADKVRAISKHIKAIESQLKNLQRRLESVCKVATRPIAEGPLEASSRKDLRTEAAKKAETEPDPSENDIDLLAMLDAL